MLPKLFVAAALVGGGHVLTGAQTTTANPDPWNSVMYTVDGNGDFVVPSPDNYTVDGISYGTGDECTDVDGRAVVVHAPNNTRIGCGVLGFDPWTVVSVMSDAAGVVADAAVDVAGYVIDDNGVTVMTDTMTAYNAFGRALVLHAEDGTRIACGCCVGEGSVVEMTTYPDYDGTIPATGNVTSTSTASPATLTLVANFEGLEANVAGGLHVHTGTSCDTAAGVGGHLYSPAAAIIGMYPEYDGGMQVGGLAHVSAVADDTAIRFSACLSDDGDTFGADETGGIHIHVGKTCASAADVGGHFYDPVCTTTPVSATTVAPTTTVNGNVTTTTAAMDPDPWNSVMYTVDGNGDFVVPSPDNYTVDGISYGTGDECTDVDGRAVVVHAPNNTRIGCGVLGFDPWTVVSVTSDAAGVVADAAVDVAGYVIDDNGVTVMTDTMTAYNAFGRALVLHAEDNTRIACGCCVGEGSVVEMTTYPDYDGTIPATGNVTTTSTASPAKLTLVANFEGLEANVAGGLHVHTGTSCDTAAGVGGHLYSPAAAIIGMYPEYDGGMQVGGLAHVSAVADDTAIRFSACLSDDGDTFGADETGGIHIHVGKTCASAADVGGHFYDPVCTTTPVSATTVAPTTTVNGNVTTTTAAMDPDPWNSVMYTVDGNGDFVVPSPDNYTVDGISYGTGDECTDVDGRAVVVHAPNNTRIGCGVLGFDPWTVVSVTSDAAGVVADAAVDVAGYVIDDNGVTVMTDTMTAYNAFGRALVLHAEDNTRIACGCCVGEGSVVEMTTYPDYDGTILATGNVTTTSTASPAKLTLVANFEGLEANVAGGLHVHTGTSCDTAAGVGGHLYSPAAAIIGMYPEYDGGMQVGGLAHVSAVADDTAIRFSACLSDDGDTFGADETGGIHIHVGKTCAAAVGVGGHFYDPVCTTTPVSATTVAPTTTVNGNVTTTTAAMDPDPWNSVMYTVDGNGDFVVPSPDNYTVDGISYGTGDECTDVDGRAVVVHAPNNTRIGCGVLGLDPWTVVSVTSDAAGVVADAAVDVAGYVIDDNGVTVMTDTMTAYNAFGRALVLHAEDNTRIACGCCVGEGSVVEMTTYPDYDGTILATGNVTTTSTASPAKLTLVANFEGLEANVAGGLHVHTGTSCDTAAGVGGHLYSPAAAIIGMYPEYDGGMQVGGLAHVSAVADDTAIRFSACLSDDGDTFGADETGGIHIHVGKTCAAAVGVGGHFYDPVCTSTTSTSTISSTTTPGPVTTTSTMFVPVVVVEGSVYGLDPDEHGTWSITSATSCAGDVFTDYFHSDLGNPFDNATTYSASSLGHALIQATLTHYSLVDAYPPFYLTVEGKAVVFTNSDGVDRACGLIVNGAVSDLVNFVSTDPLLPVISLSQDGVVLSAPTDAGLVAGIVIVILLVLGGGGGFAYYWLRVRTQKTTTKSNMHSVGHKQKNKPAAGDTISDPTLKSATAKNYKVQHAVTVAVADDDNGARAKMRSGAKKKVGATVNDAPPATAGAAKESAANADGESKEAEQAAKTIREWLELHNFSLSYEQILFEAVRGVSGIDRKNRNLLGKAVSTFDLCVLFAFRALSSRKTLNTLCLLILKTTLTSALQPSFSMRCGEQNKSTIADEELTSFGTKPFTIFTTLHNENVEYIFACMRQTQPHRSNVSYCAVAWVVALDETAPVSRGGQRHLRSQLPWSFERETSPT